MTQSQMIQHVVITTNYWQKPCCRNGRVSKQPRLTLTHVTTKRIFRNA